MAIAFEAPRLALALLLLSGLSGCVTSSATAGRDGINDPYESTNRAIHDFNRGVDRFLFRPASKGYVTIVPDPVVTSFSHVADNIGEPENVINALLQGNLKRAGTAAGRFLINTTIGFAGLADPATEFGLLADDTDFGETLHVWGVKEGAYVELPLLGPSTQRDSVGTVVDFFTNPLGYSRSQRLANAGSISWVVQRLGDRGRYSDTIDSILYESADSYAQARIIYLQNRRFELAGAGDDPYSDPYADLNALSGAGGAAATYDDPYEDPYE